MCAEKPIAQNRSRRAPTFRLDSDDLGHARSCIKPRPAAAQSTTQSRDRWSRNRTMETVGQGSRIANPGTYAQRPIIALMFVSG